jgi:hypothetical protein
MPPSSSSSSVKTDACVSLAGMPEQHRPQSFPYAYQQSEISRWEPSITGYDA